MMLDMMMMSVRSSDASEAGSPNTSATSPSPDLPIMLFSTDEVTNKAVIYAGVPPSAASSFKVLDWLTPSIAPLKGKGGGDKNGIAQGPGSDASVNPDSFIFNEAGLIFGYL
ncbi:hypothetical protein ABZP36_031353 [Zizania latifolia]